MAFLSLIAGMALSMNYIKFNYMLLSRMLHALIKRGYYIEAINVRYPGKSTITLYICYICFRLSPRVSELISVDLLIFENNTCPWNKFKKPKNAINLYGKVFFKMSRKYRRTFLENLNLWGGKLFGWMCKMTNLIYFKLTD